MESVSSVTRSATEPEEIYLERYGLAVSHVRYYQLKKKFTIKAVLNPGLGTFKMVKCYRVVSINGVLYLVLPRFKGMNWFLRSDVRLVNRITLSHVEVHPELGECHIQPTENQEIVLRHVFGKVFTSNQVAKGRAGCILEMKPGSGKTYLSTVLMSRLRYKTLVIVPNTYLLEQWQDVLGAGFGKYSESDSGSIGLYYGKVRRDGVVVILIYKSAIMAAKRGYFTFGKGKNAYDVNFSTFISTVGLTIFDESQTYCNEATSKILFSNYQTPYMLGLSANPLERPDNLGTVALWNIGPVIKATSLSGYVDNADLMNQCSTTIKRIHYMGPNKYTQPQYTSDGSISVPLMLNMITADPSRNRVIARETYRLYKENKYVFVFSDRLEHLRQLRMLIIELATTRSDEEVNMLPDIVIEDDAGAVEAPDAEKEVTRLVGGASRDVIESCIERGKIILTTYAYSSVGVSITKMNALVLATPRVSGMTQIVGRIYRLGSDTGQREIVDIVDMRTPLKHQMYKRRAALKTILHISRDISEKIDCTRDTHF